MAVSLLPKSKRSRTGTMFRWQWAPDPAVFAKALDEVARNLEDRRMPLSFAAQEIRGDIAERFRTETDPGGRKWQPWSENKAQVKRDRTRKDGSEYVYFGERQSYADYARAYPNKGILDQDGDLRRAASASSRMRISASSVFYETDGLPSAGMAHQTGVPYRSDKSGMANPLPRRSFIGPSAEADNKIFLTFGDWFDGAISLYVTKTGRIGRRHALRSPRTGQFIEA